MTWLGQLKAKQKNHQEIKKYEKALKRAWFWEVTFQKEKAAQFLESHMTTSTYHTEGIIGSAWIKIGYLYYDLKEFSKAAVYFEKGLELGKHLEFPYNSQLKKIMKAFKKANRVDLVNKWRPELIDRARYDKKFKRLEKI